MSPHLAAKLLKPASPLLHPDSAIASDSDDDMVYSPYYATSHRRSSSCSKRRRSHQLSPEVRADVVARILDPAYSGRKDYSSRVFVDPNGEEHDPDYQLFPTQPIHSRRRQPGLFRHTSSEEDLSREDQDAESEAEWARVRVASPCMSSTSSSSSTHPDPASLFGDDEWDEKEWTREVVVPVPQKRKSKPRTVYIPVAPAPVAPAPIHQDECTPARASNVQLIREDTMDSTAEAPSCGYVLRRQWATFTLHTRLSAHRMARKARRAVSVGT